MAVADLDEARGRRGGAPPAGGGRVPPNNLDAEESLLGAMLLSRDAIDAAGEAGLGADEFYSPAHGHVYASIVRLHIAGAPSDPVTVAEDLRREGVLEAVGGPAVLVSLQASTPATSNAHRYARIIRELALLRRLIGAGSEIAELGYTVPDDPYGAVDQAEARIFEIARLRSSESTKGPAERVPAVIDRIEALMSSGGMVGPASGYHDVDARLGGLRPSSLIVLGARPAMGKTAWALGAAHHVATQGRPVLYFSLEMSQEELDLRLACMNARVDSQDLMHGRLSPEQRDRLYASIYQEANYPLVIDDQGVTTIFEIRSKARRLKARMGDLGLVVVDYLQLMTTKGSEENRQLEVAAMSRGLKLLARELECPVMALSQLNRGVEMRADKRPNLGDLRESGAIENDADAVLFLYRDEVYNPESPDRGQAEVITAKHRHGPAGTDRLAFVSNYARFTNMARMF